MSPIIDLIYLLAVVLGVPWLVFKTITTGKYRRGLIQRLGFLKPRESSARCLWVHGVSVGEVLAARTIISEFARRHPDWNIVVSTTTSTGQDVARKAYPDHRVIYYPVDFGIAVARAFAAVRPSCIVLLEADLWPNFISAARRRRVPIVVANNRITARSFRGQMRFRYLSQRFLYDGIAHVTAQTEPHARRLLALGVPTERVTVVGSLKYDVAPTETDDSRKLADELGLDESHIVLVAGSTSEPEEEMLLGIYNRLRRKFENLRLVLVPRHKTRFEEVAQSIERAGFKLIRRSQPDRPRRGPIDADTVILGDTIGELTQFYGIAGLVFVGKTLIDGGGQNILEPAALGKAVLFGPSIFNFQEAADRLLGADAAVQVGDETELETALGELISNPTRASQLGAAARRVIDAGRGATARNIDIVDKVLAKSGLI